MSLACVCVLLASCASSTDRGSRLPGVRQALLPPNVHGRLVSRTMRPRYLTIHSTANMDATAADHAQYLLVKGKRSKNNPRFGRSGWVVWHFTVDDREAVEHLLPSEQGDHADYGGVGDRQSIGIEICEFRSRSRQAASLNRAARLAAILANRWASRRATSCRTSIGRAGIFDMASRVRASSSNATRGLAAAGGSAKNGSVS